jgi:hypothetical protein|uniref:VP11 n=1 Tax=viral metagenome TaxID=1070528 RepID=A0A2V0RAF2_9ZZZZ
MWKYLRAQSIAAGTKSQIFVNSKLVHSLRLKLTEDIASSQQLELVITSGTNEERCVSRLFFNLETATWGGIVARVPEDLNIQYGYNLDLTTTELAGLTSELTRVDQFVHYGIVTSTAVYSILGDPFGHDPHIISLINVGRPAHKRRRDP